MPAVYIYRYAYTSIVGTLFGNRFLINLLRILVSNLLETKGGKKNTSDINYFFQFTTCYIYDEG